MFNGAVLILLWLVVAWRVPTLWQDRWKRAPWIALAALAVALTADLPALIFRIDRVAGIADLATLIKHASGVVAAAAVLDWVAQLGRPGRVPWLRGHRAAAAAAIVCLTALFAVMPRPESADFSNTVAGGTAAFYLLVFYAYLGTAMAAAAILFWRVSQVPARGALRCGLWLLATGTSAGALYSAYQGVYLILRMSGAISPAAAVTALAAGADIENLAILLILAGMSVPALGVAWQAALDLAALRALHGLWRALIEVAPEVAAGPWQHGLWGAVRYPHVRLIRRTAEIRDAALVLRCYVPQATVTEARRMLARRGLAGSRLDAATEACWLGLAVEAVRAGTHPAAAPHVLPGWSTLPEEVRWLRLVAVAARSEDTQAVSTELAGQPVGENTRVRGR